MKHQSSSKTKVLRPEAGLVWEWKTRRRRPVDLLQEVSSSGLPRTHIERGVEGLLISRAAHNNYTNARTLFKSMPSVKMFVLSSCKRNKRSNLGTSSAMVVATMFRCLQVLCLAIVLAQINSEVECQQLATKFNQNYDNATRSNFSIIEGDSSVSPAIQEALLSGDDQASIPAIGKRSIKTWPLPFGGGNQEFTLSSAPSPSQPSAQKAHNQQQSQQQQLQQPISFAIEPPALVEYSNSTGAIIHCRPQHQQHQQQQRQMTTITVSWRLVKSTRPQFDEQELIGTSSAGARGPQQQNGQRARWPLAASSGRRRFVRQDGALVLAPFAANQLEPELHSAQYRCCLTATGSATTTSTPNTPPGSEPWRPLGLLHKQATVCSRLVRTRAVLDTQIELAVYDRFVQSNHLVVLKCQTRAQLAPHMEFTAWLRDDKILPTMDERKLAKRLRQQELTASRSSGELLAGDRSNGQEDAMAGVEEPRYLATSRGELIIRNASKQLDSGTYKCRARNKLTGQLVTSLQGGRLIIEDSFIGDSSSSSSSSAALNGAADSKSINDSAPFATVLFAQENSDTLLCAEFMSSAAAFTTTTTKSLQKFAASTAPKYHWSRWIDGQRVPITTALDYSDQRQLYTSHHHHNDHYHPHQNQLNHYRQLDSCLLISQVQAKHAGDYICDAQYMGAGVARRTLTLLVSSSKLDIQLAISKRPTPGGGYHQQFQPAGRTLSSGPGSSSALATGSNQLISLSSTSGQQAAQQQQQQQQVQYVSSGVSIELNCSTASSSGDRLLWPSGANTIAWFKDAKLLFISNLNEMSVPSNGNGMDVSLATAGSNNRQQVAPSDRFMGTTKLIQPNVISIEPFGLNDQGVYQCLVFNSDENDGDGDDTYSSPGQEEFLLDLMVGGATGSGNGGLSSGLGATTSIAQTNNTSSSSTATRREQLRSSEEFRHVMQLFELQLKRNKHSLSSTVSVQLEPLLNKPQLVQKFPPSSVYQVGATMSLECIASGLPLPRIIWFLDAFVIKDDDNNDGQWDASVGGRGGGSETSSDQDSSHLLFENWFSLAEAGSAGAGAERSFPNELINDQGRFQVSHRIAPNQMSVWSQLNVTNLNQVDMGQYKCLALNQHGQIQHTGRVNILNTSSTSSSSSDTQLALKLRSYQPTNITLIAGQNATLHCPLIGQPLVRFDWFHGGERLPTGHRQQVIPSQPSSGGSSLLLENVDPAQDGGVYTCQAQLQSSSQQTSSSIASSSSLGSAGELGSALEALSAPMDTVYNLHQQQQQPLPSASSQIHVSVHVPPLIDGQSLPEVVQANEGMRTKLVCSIVQGDHPIDIKWIRRVVSGSADQNKTVKLMSGRQLVGYEVMQNMPTTDQSAESDNHQDENGDSGGGNHVTPVSQQDAITIHNLEDSCLLTFKQISHLDRGEYICLAQNRLSLSMRRVRVVVNVAPSWSIEPPSDVYALLGSRLQLDCLAHGNPQPVATWRELTSATSGTLQQQLTSGKRSTKQAQPDVQQQFVEFVANYRQRLMPNGSLVIDQVEQTDSGVLMCEQTNGIGSGLSKLINVHVQIPPYFIRPSSSTSSSSLATPSSAGPSAAKQPMPVSYGPIGTSRAAPALTQIGRIGAGVELKCSAAGNQPMLIGWRKDVSDVIDLRSDKRRLVSSELKQLPGIEQQVLESTLRLANLTRQDSGHYNCIASNEFGTEELQLRLLVQEAPEEPQLLRPIKTEPRQAILTFKRPFDGNNPIRKYSIHYRQLNVDEASGNIQSGQQQQSQDLNSASLNASSEWKQVLLDAPSQQQQQQQHEHELGLVDLDVDQLVQLSLCCLKPFTKYRVRVGAINEIGQSALSKPVDFQTEEEAIGGPPLDVSVEPTGAHSLKVRWREPSRQLQNGLIRGYYIGYRALVPLGGAGRQNPFLVGAGGQPAATTTLGASSTSSLASNTDASEQYQYKNVQLDLSATTFAPFGDQLATSGQLAGANNLSSMMMMMMGSSSTGTVPTDNHQQQQLYSTYLTNLRRKTAYSIIVQAYNKIGAGPRSDQIIVSTLDAAPPMSPQLKWISSSYNSAEFAWVSRRFSSLAAGGRSSSSLLSSHLTKRLDDLGPTQQAGGNQQQQFSERQLQPFDLMDDDDPQAYYTVNYKLDDRHFQTQRDVNGGQSMPANGEWQQLRLTKPMGVSSSVLQQQLPAAALVMNQQQQHQQQQQQQQPAHGRQAQQRLSFVLSNLRCGSAYLAYMTATNSLGQSEPGETVKFITRGGAPVAPTNSNDFLQINTTYLVLRLGAWSNAGCPISSFLIKYKLDSQSTMTIIEHQVLPTIQTTTIAGSSVFSTRPQLIGSGGGAGGDGGRQTAGLLLNSQHIQSEAAAQHHQQQLLQLQRHQQLLSDFILRNLMPSSNYKLIVEANSEAGSTTAEYDFETANFTSALLSINVNGLVASEQQPKTTDGEQEELANGGANQQQHRHHRPTDASGSGGVGGSIMNSFMLGGGSGAAGGIWQAANKQTVGVWSLTVLFVVASILMAITTLALGFKSLLRLKHHSASSSPGGGGSGARSSSLDNLVSSLFCCSASSTSSSSSSSSSAASSGSSNGCYRMASSEHQFGVANLESTKNVYCSLPLGSAATTNNNNNGSGISGQHQQQQFDSGVYHHHSQARLRLDSPDGSSGCVLGATNDLGAATISGLLRDASDRPGALEMSLARGDHQDADGSGQLPYRGQLVSSSSLSALLNDGGVNCFGPAAHSIYAPSNHLQQQSANNRHTMTLAPLSRINRLTELRLQQLNNTIRTGSHYAATLGRQQQSSDNTNCLFSPANHEHHHQHHQAKLEQSVALYGHILNNNTGGHNKLQLEGDQRAASIPNQMMAMDGRMTMDTQVDDGQANSGGQAIAASTTDTTSYLSYPANLADELASATSGYSTAPSLTGGYQRTELASSNASFKQSTQRNHHAGTIGRQQQQQAYKKQLDYVTRHQSSGEICNQAALAAATTYRPETTTHGGECMEAFLYNRQQQHDQLQTEQQYEPTPPLPQVSATTMSSIIFGGTEQNEQQKQQNQGQQQQQQLSMLSGSGQQQQQQACNGAGQLMSAPGNSIQQFMPVTSDAYGMIFGHQGELVQHQQQHHNDQEQHHQ